MSDSVLKSFGISKRFPGVLALNSVDFNLNRGGVGALVGENGAGKSTLIKIFAGIIQPDKGEIFLDDQKIVLGSPKKALANKISVIFQELSYFPDLSVEENIFFGVEPRNRFGTIKKIEISNRARELLSGMSLGNINPKALMRDLSVAQKQLIEICKALVRDARIIIMDEPTSALSNSEVKILFKTISDMKRKGISILLITHKIEEIFKFGVVDQVTILRDGQVIDSQMIADITPSGLIRKMVGREISELFPKKCIAAGKEILRVENLTKEGVFQDISFHLCEGEILGFAGLVGAKRTEVMSGIFGLFPLDSGKILVNGEQVSIRTPHDAMKAGIVMVPEDRQLCGLFLELSIMMNISSPNLKSVSRNMILSTRREYKAAKNICSDLQVKSSGMLINTNSLSGGNQQKVVLGKNILHLHKILILDEPTKGIDVGAKREFHSLMCRIAEKNVGVIMVSSELPEILGMSDRIIVMHEGEKTGEFMRSEATQENIMNAAIGNVQNSFTGAH